MHELIVLLIHYRTVKILIITVIYLIIVDTFAHYLLYYIIMLIFPGYTLNKKVKLRYVVSLQPWSNLFNLGFSFVLPPPSPLLLLYFFVLLLLFSVFFFSLYTMPLSFPFLLLLYPFLPPPAPFSC